MLWLMFIMIKSCSATLHRVNCLITGSYTSKKHTTLKSIKVVDIYLQKHMTLNCFLEILGVYNDACPTLRTSFPKAVAI